MLGEQTEMVHGKCLVYLVSYTDAAARLSALGSCAGVWVLLSPGRLALSYLSTR